MRKQSTLPTLSLFSLALCLAPLACTAEVGLGGMGQVDDGLESGMNDDDDNDGEAAGGELDGGGTDEAGGGMSDEGAAGEAGAADGETDEGGMDGGAEAEAEVDLLLVIDNSASMALEQLGLDAELLDFVAEAFEIFANTDASIHVGVITSDDPLLSLAGVDPGCENGGEFGYLEHSGPADDGLLAQLDCALDVGLLGDIEEQPIDSLLEALSPSGPAVNQGFLRPEATLIVVIIGDEDDLVSVGDPELWLGELVDLHSEGELVMLGLLGDDSEACASLLDLPLLDGILDITTQANPTPRISAMVQATEHHELGSICEPDHSDFFDLALSTIADVSLSN